MTPDDPHAILGVDANASELEIKRAFRARAKALHPDTSSSDVADDAFHALKHAYETLLARRGGVKDPMDDALGPGMRARLDAARKWRERSDIRGGEGIKPAREWTNAGAGTERASASGNERASASVGRSKSTGRAFDEDQSRALDELLKERRAMRASGDGGGFFMKVRASAASARGRRVAVALGVGFCGSVIVAHKITKINEERRATERA